MPYQLTEDNIKHATLSFLKTYYKNNSSRGFGDTVATLDMKAGDGIIADGYLKFSVNTDPLAGLSGAAAEKAILEDKIITPTQKSSFLATFEATSQKTAGEIQYAVQNTLLILDALAVASIVAAGSYGYNYLNNQFTLNQLGTIPFFAGFFAVLLASMGAFILLVRNLLPRYRYIYALAQFKKYHADEQWVSYGEDVFAYPDNKYLLELKKQCINQGFGLIMVDKDLQPSLVITPARKTDQSARKKLRQFFAQHTENKKMFKWAYGIKVPAFKVPLDTKDYKRFTQSYWKQAGIMFAMLLVMGQIYLKELKNPNIAFVDETKYESILKQETRNNRPEPLDVMEDEDEIDAKKAKVKPSVKTQTTVVATPPLPTPIPPQTKTNDVSALIISIGDGEYISYGCDRLAGLEGNNFLVQLDVAKSSTEAIKKVKIFNESGFKCNALWLGCFENTNKEYVVYLDDIFESKDMAVQRATDFQKLLFEQGINKSEPPIRMISGK